MMGFVLAFSILTNTREHLTQNHSEEWQAADSWVEAVDLLEHDGIESAKLVSDCKSSMVSGCRLTETDTAGRR